MAGGVGTVKLLGEICGIAGSAVTALVAAGDSVPLTGTAIVAVLGFATLLVRSVLANQHVYVEIVAQKDRELAERDDTIHYLRWENDSIRFRHGEREIDPGPYVPRRPVLAGPGPTELGEQKP